MNTMIRLVTALLVVNLFMYIGVNFAMSADGQGLNENYNFRFNGDLIDQILAGYTTVDEISQDLKDNWTSYGFDIDGNFTAIPDQQEGAISDDLAFGLDGLKIVWGFILLLGNIVISPLTLFFNFRVPVLVGMMVGIPYFFLLFMTIIAMIRGVAD